MLDAPYDEANAAAIDFEIVNQFARILRLQARILDADGDHQEATLLRARAARTVRHVTTVQ